jgi:hypothetical protein
METARTEVGALRDALSDGRDHLAAAVQGGGNPNLLTDPMEPVPPDRHWYSVWCATPSQLLPPLVLVPLKMCAQIGTGTVFVCYPSRPSPSSFMVSLKTCA